MAYSILDTHPIFETWDARRALRTLARALVRVRPGAQRWFVIWPAVAAGERG